MPNGLQHTPLARSCNYKAMLLYEMKLYFVCLTFQNSDNLVFDSSSIYLCVAFCGVKDGANVNKHNVSVFLLLSIVNLI